MLSQTSSILNFNIACCVLGGCITLFGLVSHLLRNRWYLTEPVVFFIIGTLLSPYGFNLVRPIDIAHSESAVLTTTLCFTRLVLGIQLVVAGIELPGRYLLKEWRALALLLGPGMAAMWLCTSAVAWFVVPRIDVLQSLVIGACVTPTDPVLSVSIVKGDFADKYLSKRLRDLIVAESGANDGLGYIFLFLPLHLINALQSSADSSQGMKKALLTWLWETCVYTIVLSVVYGAAAGWVARKALRWAKTKGLVDRESFSSFAIGVALFIVGTVGVIDSDDVLACFIAGCAFAWDDWFTQEIEEDLLHGTLDMFFNMAVFIWLGAVCPWSAILSVDVVPFTRLFALGFLVLLVRRLPFIIALRSRLEHIEDFRQALIMGFFGPIGISAIFYLHVSVIFLKEVAGGSEDVEDFVEVIVQTVWFMVVSSIFVHGLSVPVGSVCLRVWKSCSKHKLLSRKGKSRLADEGERSPLLA